MTKIPAQIRRAEKHEAALLTELAMCSKAYWGYSDEFMQSCRQELLVSEQKLVAENLFYYVAQIPDAVIGFYALEKVTREEFELEALFVRPEHIGRGVGTLLINHAKDLIRSLIRSNGGNVLLIQGEPNAAGFYQAIGAQHIGARESASIPGRFLPLYKIILSKADPDVAGKLRR